MKIDAIDVYRVEMPLIYPFRTAFGNDAVIETVLVRMRSGELVGWGEATPWSRPGYSSECAAGAFLVVNKFLAPALLGEEIGSGEELQDRLLHVKGNNFAKASLDQACWDIHARSRQEPLWQTLGGQQATVDVGADFGIMESVELLIETIAQAVEAGFKRIKLKYRPGWELEMIGPVRQAFPQTVFHVDCNSAYTLDDIDMLKQLDDYDLAMIEQPLMNDDLIDHATLQEQISTPICLDESITSVAKARKAIQIGACGWVNIKPGRVGGITNALAIHDLCRDADIPCWIGGMLESAVGGNQCLALATLENIKYPSDVFPTDRFYATDIADKPLVLSGPSQATAHDLPGCGVVPDADRLAAQTLQSESHG